MHVAALLAALTLSAGLPYKSTTTRTTARTAGSVPASLSAWSFNYSGPVLQEPAGTVAHVYSNGSALVDTKGNTWIEGGTVAKNAAQGVLYPNGFSAASRSGFSGFNGSNFFKLDPSGNGNDPLDFAGDFGLCLVMVGTPTVLAAPVGNMTANSGWGYMINTLSDHRLRWADAGGYHDQSLSGSLVQGGVNLVCFGRNGGTGISKVNVNAATTGGAHTPTAATTAPMYIGTHSLIGSFNAGAIMEVLAWSGSPSSAQFDAIAAQFFGLNAGGYGPSALSVSRAASEACQVAGGPLFYVPANTLCVTNKGVQRFGANRQLLLNSNTFTSSWTTNNLATPLKNATGPDGVANSAWTLQTTNSNGEHRIYQGYTMTNGTNYTCSGYGKAGNISWLGVMDNSGVGFGSVDFSTCTKGVTDTAVEVENLGNGWCRWWLSRVPINSVTNYCTLNIADTEAHARFGVAWASNGTHYLLLANTKAVAEKVPSPYVESAGSQVDQPALIASFDQPLTGAPTSWCVTTVGTQAKWQTGVARLFWSFGVSGDSSIWGSLFGNTSDNLTIREYEPGTGNFNQYETAATVNAWADGSTHTVTICSNAGTRTAAADGAAFGDMALISGNAGAASQFRTPIYIGSRSGGDLSFNGYISRIRLCKSGANFARCP